MLVTKFKYVIFLFASVVFWDSIFFFRSIPDIIVAYCIYVDMKVIAMKANIRSYPIIIRYMVKYIHDLCVSNYYFV